MLASRRYEQTCLLQHGTPARINIKAFRNVPIADFEVLLPAQTPRSQPYDFARIVVAVVLAVAAVCHQVLDDEAGAVASVWDAMYQSMLVLAAVASYIISIVFQYQCGACACLPALTAAQDLAHLLLGVHPQDAVWQDHWRRHQRCQPLARVHRAAGVPRGAAGILRAVARHRAHGWRLLH